MTSRVWTEVANNPESIYQWLVEQIDLKKSNGIWSFDVLNVVVVVVRANIRSLLFCVWVELPLEQVKRVCDFIFSRN